MKRTPMELAAMASAAVPGLTPTGVAGSPDDAADFDAALLIDDAGRRWRVRSPKHLEASMRLETELLVLRTFVPAVRAELPFALPYVAGTVRQGELCTFVYSHLPGAIRSIDTLMTSGRSVATEIGRAMAAIHAIPRELVTKADLPSYSANEFRQRRLNELDQAATTGKIPAVLLRRWEHALEDVSLWRFKPTVVHGDLHEDNILLTGERVSAVTGWTDLRVGDPADDFAWLIAANDPKFTETVHAAYLEASNDPEDPHLIRRAALSAEFALAQWLVRGVAAENSTMVDEAVEMLGTLEEDVLAQEASDRRDSQARTANARTAEAEAAAAVRPAAAKVTVAPIAPEAAPAASGADDAAPDTGSVSRVVGTGTGSDTENGADTATDSPEPGESERATVRAVEAEAEADEAVVSGVDAEPGNDPESGNEPVADSAPGDGAPRDGHSSQPGTETTTLPLTPVPDK
ncbi:MULTISPECIES: phosphotransferase [unclassified Arthrobacter]|uniref:phosphotransferase n=1 Tax=unclassified Arthrobacter TaxID=235627 RepID=UPI0024E0333C|nr:MULTISPECIES: phosphotransferase [unclassified Arthrobacter]MCC9146415.1 phosphotransferase [Arthrobacter sp. zg-Y919]MDK1277645.1 phosphotransferase [Arthrobacter sp. zg.Y919]WIB02393.1 phosphotransferase [Arthrobacter sp. zg-Y919]